METFVTLVNGYAFNAADVLTLFIIGGNPTSQSKNTKKRVPHSTDFTDALNSVLGIPGPPVKNHSFSERSSLSVLLLFYSLCRSEKQKTRWCSFPLAIFGGDAVSSRLGTHERKSVYIRGTLARLHHFLALGPVQVSASWNLR